MATELAKAYVQIVPSAKGIKGSMTQALSGEADSAGASTGKTMGGSMMGALKNVIIAAGIGKAIGAAIGEGAALEQSIGGIETLFKGNADKIKQYATQAYASAGLSANDYMQTVTGFSASLLQGLGGDTAKAAEISNMAIVDMADNANKMGTSMDSIRETYQGFAKQNYTMLDNLKLGYGGTKKEMERLLADARKITGVKYDIGNLSEVYSAIHAIQGELDITGTTAKEASTTISGSAAAMQSSFKNVLANLTLGEDLKPSLNALASTANTFLIGNLLPAIGNIFTALPGAIVTFSQAAFPQVVTAFMGIIPQLKAGLTGAAPQLLQMAQSITAQLISGVTTEFPKLLEQGANILKQIINGAMTALPQLFQAVLTIITGLITAFFMGLPQYIETGKNILITLISGIQQALPKMLVAAGEAIGTLLRGIVTNLPKIISAGLELITSLIAGIGKAMPQIIKAAGQVVATIWDTIKNINWVQLGMDVISGIINGIGSMAGALWEAVENIAKSIFECITSALGIASPSKLMRDKVGPFIPSGIAIGIMDNLNPVKKAMQAMSGIVESKMQSSLSLDILQSKSKYGFAPPSQSRTTNYELNQVINTHDSLSPAEMTQEAENLIERLKWSIP